MKKNYVVIQDGMKSCGSACLLSIIRYYGGNVPMDYLEELTNITKDGTNFYNIAKAANEIGLSAKAYQIDNLSKLKDTRIPFICQVIINNCKHFVVVYQIKNDAIMIMDPAHGMCKKTVFEFNKIWTGYVLTFMPYKSLPFYYENNYLKEIIKSTLQSNNKTILCLIALTMLCTILAGIYGYYLKIIVDDYLNVSSLFLVTLVFLIMIFIRIVVEYLRGLILTDLSKKIDTAVIDNTIRKVIFLPYNYYKNKTTGEMIARINDLFYLKNIIIKIITTVFFELFLAIFILSVLFCINVKMTMLLLSIIIVYFLAFISYYSKEKDMAKIIQESNAELSSILTESINSFETIKGLNIENIFISKINIKCQNAINSYEKLAKCELFENLIRSLVEGPMILLIMFLGITKVVNNEMSLGMFLTYNAIMYLCLNPIKNVLDFYREYYYVKKSIMRVNYILNYKYEKLDAISDNVIYGDIRIHMLDFGYNDENVVLKNVSLDIPMGSKILLLGKTGSGKSTLLKLLYRYYDPPSNHIFVNNKDILSYALSDIRKDVLYISQNEFLYTDTIKNNLILDREVSLTKLNDVCDYTYVSDIVNNNSESLNKMISENGFNISGGEKQRIILARSLLKDSSIILIDEGLNQIDVSLERKILINLFNNYKNKTFIIVSHRKNNFDLFDSVYELRDKKIINVKEA